METGKAHPHRILPQAQTLFPLLSRFCIIILLSSSLSPTFDRLIDFFDSGDLFPLQFTICRNGFGSEKKKKKFKEKICLTHVIDRSDRGKSFLFSFPSKFNGQTRGIAIVDPRSEKRDSSSPTSLDPVRGMRPTVPSRDR